MKTTDASTPLTTTRKQHWVSEQARFEASGFTVREFCRQNNIGVSAFYQRRAKLRALGYLGIRSNRAAKARPLTPATSAGFIDAGVLGVGQSVSSNDVDTQVDTKQAPSSAMSVAVTPTVAPTDINDQHSALDLRLDLGLGVVLTIVRR
jgi:hypothetical protein